MVALVFGSEIPGSHYPLENGVYIRPNCMINLSAAFVQIRIRFSVYDLASFPSCATIEPFSYHAKLLASTFETAQLERGPKPRGAKSSGYEHVLLLTSSVW